jgi:ABC-type antimicrobial peptide transport system permease subunit
MLTHYLRLAFRTFFKNKTAFLINLIGMSIALGTCITAWVNYEYNSQFDQTQENAGKLYRIGFWQTTERRDVPYGVCPLPVANLLTSNIGEGEHVIQYISKGSQFRILDELFEREFIYTDPAFTSVFNMERLSGSLSLADKTQVLISDKLAITYFGTTEVVGKPLTQLVSGEPREFVIGGVFRQFPANSSFRFQLITNYENYFSDPATRSTSENDWSRWATTFLYLNDKRAADVIEKQMQQYVNIQNEARPDLKVKEFYVEPFVGMSQRAVAQKNQGHWLNMPMPPAGVIAPFAMAGFILIVACFNFMNNAIAVSGRRLKEIGIRKVIGIRRRGLVVQFLSETMVFCLLSLGLAVVLAEYFVTGWNGMWSGIEIAIRYSNNYSLIIAIGSLMIIAALLAGGYPAFYISWFKPVEILRGNSRFGGANLLTRSLLVIQFSISLAAVIFALAFYFNSKYQKEYDLGYSWRSVIQVPVANGQQFEALRNELSANPSIHSIGGSQHHIYASSYKVAARYGTLESKEVDVLNVGDNYFETVNVRVIAGRPFQADQVSDVKESIIVNEEFVRKFGLGEDAIGKRFLFNDTTQLFIVGMVKDVYLQALFQPLSPLAFRYVDDADYRYLVASTDPEQIAAVNTQMKASWQKLYPTYLYPGQLMESRMMMALEHFDSVVILYTFMGIVAIMMSVSGLYSLVALNLQKRTKEFGIRKIMGATISQVTLMASRQFIIIMLISFVIGAILGGVMVNGLMNSVWEYYVAVNATVLTLAISILAFISLLAIGFKIGRFAVSNPVDAIRHE